MLYSENNQGLTALCKTIFSRQTRASHIDWLTDWELFLGDVIYVLIYVDDIFLTGSNSAKIAKLRHCG